MNFAEQMEAAGVTPEILAVRSKTKVWTIKQYMAANKPSQRCQRALDKLSSKLNPPQENAAPCPSVAAPTVRTKGAEVAQSSAPLRGKVMAKWVPNKRMRYIDTGTEVVIAWTRADKYRKAGQEIELMDEGGRWMIKKESNDRV
jgi:hypothetical protein